MKKLFFLIIIFISTILNGYTQDKTKSSIDWNITPEELLKDNIGNVIKDTSWRAESKFSFDTVNKTSISLKKVFWDINFMKVYNFENNKLAFVMIVMQQGQVNNGSFRGNLYDYSVYYRRMHYLLATKYGKPSSSEDTELWNDLSKLEELFDEGETISITTKWQLPKEYIHLSFFCAKNLGSTQSKDDALIVFSIEYQLNSYAEKSELKSKLEKKKRLEKRIQKQKAENKAVLKDI